jgi:type II secretory pathway pseudopilin PulG
MRNEKLLFAKLKSRKAAGDKMRKKHCDNRGSSIVIVIIAMGMIGILATTLLWTAYMNYRIKVSDIRNKNSFYSAETVVEQIMAGAQNEASEAVKSAYQETMKNWDNDTNPADSAASQENHFNTFATVYLDTLVDAFKDSAKGSGYYDRAILKTYVDEKMFAPDDYPGVDVLSWENGNAQGEAKKEPKMEIVNNNSIILRNVYVSYTDENDLLSIVQTDICLDVPALVFAQEGSVDYLYEYSLIGNTGIDVAASSGTVSAEGSMYAGADGFKVNSASTLTIDDAKNIVCKGDIQVNPVAGFVVRDMPGYANTVYARNLKLESGTLSLDSVTYVANDLTLSGTGSKATLTKEYYGYGVSTATGLVDGEDILPGESSAIIINGKSSTVDLSGIKKLLLAGRAYIGQNVKEPLAEESTPAEDTESDAESPAEEKKSSSVMMGESIAVKGNQIAYLVPAECIGTDGDTLLVGQNPVSSEQASDMIEYQNESSEKYLENFQEVDFNKAVYKLGNKTLSDFGVTSMKNIRKVYTTYGTGDGAKTLGYYYLVLDKDKAAEYFSEYYNFNSSKTAIDNYFDKYASGGIVLGDYENTDGGNQYTILGNSLVSSALSDSGVTLLNGIAPDVTTDDEGEDTGDEDAAAGYQEISENTGELTNTSTEAQVLTQAADIAASYTELENTLLFDKVIKETALNDYLTDQGVNEMTFTTDAGLKAVVTRKDNINTSSCGDVRLIISTGDVTIDTNKFEGMIIAKGTIHIGVSASSIKKDEMGVYKVLSAKSSVEGDTVTPIDFFVNGGGSLTNSVEKAEVDDAGNLDIDYSEIVRYMNWIKK